MGGGWVEGRINGWWVGPRVCVWVMVGEWKDRMGGWVGGWVEG